MRAIVAISVLAFAVACTGEKKFKSSAQTGTAEKEAPKAVVQAPAPVPAPAPKSEAAVAPQTPAVPVEKFGINFEDTEGGDADYNDAVLCFKGKFTVAGSDILSREDQKIKAETFSASGCQHSIEIHLTRSGGKSEMKVFDATKKESGELELKKGDILDVKMTTTDDLCKPDQKRSMKDSKFAKILKDVCNDTGK